MRFGVMVGPGKIFAQTEFHQVWLVNTTAKKSRLPYRNRQHYHISHCRVRVQRAHFLCDKINFTCAFFITNSTSTWLRAPTVSSPSEEHHSTGRSSSGKPELLLRFATNNSGQHYTFLCFFSEPSRLQQASELCREVRRQRSTTLQSTDRSTSGKPECSSILI